MLGGLEHDRVAGRERRTDLDRDEEKLGVPRHEAGDHSEGLAQAEDAEVRLVDREGVAVDLVREPGVVVEEIGNVARLPPRFLEQLARVDGLGAAQIL